MKRFVKGKKALSVILASIIAVSVVSCGGDKKEENTTVKENTPVVENKDTDEIKKPEQINVLIDTVFGSQTNPSSWDTWLAKYKELTGIEMKLTKPEHNEYYQKMSLAFTTGDIPDIMEIGSVNYPTYANNGALWDMTEAWENSELKASGIVEEKYVDGLKINDVLYGFPMARGNGTITFVRQDWLDNLGMEAPTNYEEFTEMLRAFTEDDPDQNGANDTYGMTMPGLLGNGAPYDLYQREYYQDAKPFFYQKDDGTWVDGMLEPQMIEALQRMKDHFKAGYLDQEVITNKTSTSRDKFYAGNVGVFNYWAGNWNVTLQNNLTAQNPDGIVVPIPAIKETYYVERPATALAITTKCENPEGVFKYLVEFSHDGGEGELLFTRGVEGFHYSIENGVYSKLPDAENEKVLVEKTWFSPELKITNFEDPIELDERVIKSLLMFTEDAQIAAVPAINDTISQYEPDLLAIRELAIATAVTSDTSVLDAINTYKTDGAKMIEEILKSLNE